MSKSTKYFLHFRIHTLLSKFRSNVFYLIWYSSQWFINIFSIVFVAQLSVASFPSVFWHIIHFHYSDLFEKKGLQHYDKYFITYSNERFIRFYYILCYVRIVKRSQILFISMPTFFMTIHFWWIHRSGFEGWSNSDTSLYLFYFLGYIWLQYIFSYNKSIYAQNKSS